MFYIKGKRTLIKRTLIICFLLFIALSLINAKEGKDLFKINCSSCHKLDKKLIGPALKDVEARWEKRENLIEWIKDANTYLKNNPNDKYAHKIFADYNEIMMPPVSLTDEEIIKIIDYMNGDNGAAESTSSVSSTPPVEYNEKGKKIFKVNCSSCHKLNKKLVGPALSGVENRWESKHNLMLWIKNSQKYLEDHPKDQYAHNLFEEYNNSVMTAMPLSEEEIADVLDYIRNPIVTEEKKVSTTQSQVKEDSKSSGFNNTVLAIMIIVILVVLSIVFIGFNKELKKSLIEKNNENELKELDEINDIHLTFKQRLRGWFYRNKIFTSIFAVVVLLIILNYTWNFIFNIGVYQGYSPEQPIKFSHKIHAGNYQISCLFCHAGAEESKHAGIPSVNVCMNCHKGIQEGTLYGTEEISKIHTAAGFNTETQSFDKKEKLLEWTKIHNLPDHVYFNHSQHVTVGKVECQTCHGEVQTFDYPMKQFAPLTMRWCIDCHKETNVQMEGNAYYDKMHAELKEKYKKEGIENFTVSQIGGLECAKCHY